MFPQVSVPWSHQPPSSYPYGQQQSWTRPPAAPNATAQPSVPIQPGYGLPAPPPVPPGVDPNHWRSGYWRYQPQPGYPQQQHPPQGAHPPPSMVGWTAAGWGIPQQYYFPPKQPRRPDPTYWQTQLTDNGLGLQ